MNYKELKRLFCEHESGHPEFHLTAYITFSSFGPKRTEELSWDSRTYIISSNNKAFQPNMSGCSVFGSCLDGTNRCIRLDAYMAEEQGSRDGWVIEECSIVVYMLMEHSDYGIATPKIVCTMETAQQEMLLRLAGFLRADPMPLIKQYSRNNYEVTGDYFYVKKYNAYASTAKYSGSWAIKPVYIRSLLDIRVGNERR